MEHVNLPWNTLDMLQKALDAGSDEITFSRNNINVNVESRNVQENFWAYESGGSSNADRFMPRITKG